MKLLFCKECNDVVNLASQVRYCNCKRSTGKYTDRLHVDVSGPCVVLGIDNNSLFKALLVEPKPNVLGPTFHAFIIHSSDRVTRV